MTDADSPATPAPGDRRPAPTAAPRPDAVFRERLLPSPGVWAALLLNAVLFGIIALRLGQLAGVVTLLVTFAVTGGLLLRSSPLIEVADGMFVAGRARVPVGLLGPAEALDAEPMRLARGPELDARAYLCIRGWIAPGVRVRLEDPQDPTPYWLVSSRRPQELAAALESARA